MLFKLLLYCFFVNMSYMSVNYNLRSYI